MTNQDNMRAYRNVIQGAQGGAYGGGNVFIPGRTPQEIPVYFDDGVIIRSDNPSTPFYNAGEWTAGILAYKDIDGGADRRIEMILKLSISILTLAGINIACYNLLNEAISGKRSQRVRATVLFTLLKVPLAVGVGNTYGLDVATWDLMHYLNTTSDSGKGGTRSPLYQTATNFESDDAHWQILDGAVSGDPIERTPFLAVNVNTEQNRSKKSEYNFAGGPSRLLPVPRIEGPYYGIHMALGFGNTSRHLFNGGVAPTDAGESYIGTAFVDSPRITTRGMLRSFGWSSFPFF